MFCKYCGKENTDDSIYCSHDGQFLHEPKNSIKKIKDEVNFCKNCGNKTDLNDLYCDACGNSLYEEEKSKKVIAEQKQISQEKEAKKSTIKNVIKNVAIGTMILLIIGFFVSSIANDIISEEVSKQIKITLDLKILKMYDILLILNGVPLTLGAKLTKYGNGNMNMTGMPFIILLIPFLIYFVMGILKSRDDIKNDRVVNIKEIILTGFVYGLIVMIIGFTNSESIGFGFGVSFNKTYSSIVGLINGVFIASGSMLAGYSVYSKLKKNKDVLGENTFIFDGAFIFTIILLFISIASVIMYLVKFGTEKTEAVLELSQIGGYMLLLTNFGVYTEGLKKGSVSLIKSSGYILEKYGQEIVIFIGIMILLQVILFFIYGKRNSKKDLKKIIYTTLSYSIFVGALAHMSYISASTVGHIKILGDLISKDITMGFSILPNILGAFILSTIPAILGYFIFRKKDLQ